MLVGVPKKTKEDENPVAPPFDAPPSSHHVKGIRFWSRLAQRSGGGLLGFRLSGSRSRNRASCR